MRTPKTAAGHIEIARDYIAVAPAYERDGAPLTAANRRRDALTHSVLALSLMLGDLVDLLRDRLATPGPAGVQAGPVAWPVERALMTVAEHDALLAAVARRALTTDPVATGEALTLINTRSARLPARIDSALVIVAGALRALVASTPVPPAGAAPDPVAEAPTPTVRRHRDGSITITGAADVLNLTADQALGLTVLLVAATGYTPPGELAAEPRLCGTEPARHLPGFVTPADELDDALDRMVAWAPHKAAIARLALGDGPGAAAAALVDLDTIMPADLDDQSAADVRTVRAALHRVREDGPR